MYGGILAKWEVVVGVEEPTKVVVVVVVQLVPHGYEELVPVQEQLVAAKCYLLLLAALVFVHA